MTKKNLLSALVALMTFTACNTLPDFRDGIVLEEFVYEPASFPSCHASTFAETPTGLVTFLG